MDISSFVVEVHGFIASKRGSGSWVRLPGTEAADIDGGMLDLTQAVPPAPPELAAASERARSRWIEQLSGSGYQPHGLVGLRERIAERFER